MSFWKSLPIWFITSNSVYLFQFIFIPAQTLHKPPFALHHPSLKSIINLILSPRIIPHPILSAITSLTNRTSVVRRYVTQCSVDDRSRQKCLQWRQFLSFDTYEYKVGRGEGMEWCLGLTCSRGTGREKVLKGRVEKGWGWFWSQE